MLARLILMLALGACDTPPAGPTQPEGSATSIAIYLVAHDGHTGIVIRPADSPAGLLPERRDFPKADYIEIGWGNRNYYYGRDQGFWGTLAAIVPSPSVVHVAGFRGPPAGFFRDNEIIELDVSLDGYQELIRYVHEAFERPGEMPVDALGPGLYGDSRFYPAWESFHLFRTCNVWTARALRAAGLPIRDAITMEGLMSQAREVGSTVNRPANHR